MTTIVYRDGIIGADTSSYTGTRYVGEMFKIGRNEAGDLAAGAGSAQFAAKFLDWFVKGEVGDCPTLEQDDHGSDSAFIVRAKTRAITVYEVGGKFDVEASFYATGSGSSVALGAMWMGANAYQAVQAAAAMDAYTDYPLVFLSDSDGSLHTVELEKNSYDSKRASTHDRGRFGVD